MAVVRRGGFRKTFDEDRLLFNFFGLEVMERERLCSRARLRRARARLAAMVSGEGGSPKMKNLMNAPISITIDNWPRRKPSVKDSLAGRQYALGFKSSSQTHEDCGGESGGVASVFVLLAINRIEAVQVTNFVALSYYRNPVNTQRNFMSAPSTSKHTL